MRDKRRQEACITLGEQTVIIPKILYLLDNPKSDRYRLYFSELDYLEISNKTIPLDELQLRIDEYYRYG